MKGEARDLGLERGRRSLQDEKKSRYSVIGSFPAPHIGHKTLFLVIMLFRGKASSLHSLRDRYEFPVSLQGLDCFQLKRIPERKRPTSGRAVLNPLTSVTVPAP